MAARCFSTRSASCPRPRRCDCCASSRTPKWCGSAESGRFASTCGSLRPRTAICRGWSRSRPSARISTIASRCFRSSFRRCAIARATSAHLPSTSPNGRRTDSVSVPVPVSDDDVRRLAAYQWPGNVREMAAVMDRAVLIGQGRTLNVAGALGQGSFAAGSTSPASASMPDAGAGAHRPARRRDPAAHRVGSRGDQWSSGGPAWRGAPAADQPAYTARPHAQAEDRLARFPQARTR